MKNENSQQNYEITYYLLANMFIELVPVRFRISLADTKEKHSKNIYSLINL